jgi:hypothetical protein
MGVVVVFTLLQVTGILGVLAGGDGHEHDVDHDVDADCAADGHDANDSNEHEGTRTGFASSLGFGTLPFSMIWETFALVGAATGYALNMGYLGRPGGPPLLTLAWTLPAAVLAGGGAVVGLARSLGPVFASKDHEATSRGELVGQMGVVISSRVSADFGEIRIRDKTGHDLRVVCKLAPGARLSPVEYARVVVIDCDERGELLVEALDDSDEARSPGHTPG